MMFARWFCMTGTRQFPRSADLCRCTNGRSLLSAHARRLSLLSGNWKTPAGLVPAVAVILCACLYHSSPARAEEPAAKSAQESQAGQGPRAKVTNPHGPTIGSCQNCHTYTSWKPIRSMPEFNHDQTRYPLRGMHQNVGCNKCHMSLMFKNVSTQCGDCHADLHRGQFGNNCQSCHSVKGWQVSARDIQNHQNRFPLVGAHAMLECEACHKGAATGRFVGLSTECYSCHQQDFKTAVPDHSAFPTQCQSCHSMDTWFGAKFNHLAVTGFALTGMHATLECTACHIDNKFKGTPAACYSCHQTEFMATTSPRHAQAGLPHDCAICHTTANWLNAKFDHAGYTGYALTGMHATVSCIQCHTGGKFNNTPVDCYSCHKADFNGTTNPNHVSSGMPTDCSICHSTNGWSPASFDHSKTTFPLTGAHLTVACSQCHVNNNYTTLPTDCFGCHKNDYNVTNNPNHATAGFPTTCATCHNTSSWAGAVFDHSKTPFPLTGAHVTVACTLCHINNVFAGTPTDCYSCHKSDYNGTTNPNHTTAGFPTTCATCHTTTAWTGATFNHTWFPTNHGGANGVCATCHTNSADYSVFTCTNCHGKTSTDQRHNGINGYVYNSVNCYACHKSGGGG